MVLRRIGNKSRIAGAIIQYFPPHKTYIEPFFGAGGLFFNKPKARYNILNDNDSEVFNLFQVITHRKDELIEVFKTMPQSEDLWEHWKENKETDPILKALRFLMLSNYGYMGMPNTMRFNGGNTAQILLDNINATHEFLFGCEFMNADFRDVFKKIPIRKNEDPRDILCYCDPPYIGTADNYEESFTEKDSSDLFDVLEQSGVSWAMSEFDHPFILSQAKERGLVVNYISERQNLKNRRLEVLVTNYRRNTLFDNI